jgi:hypothetical protein
MQAELLKIPGVGSSLAQDLNELGIHEIGDLIGSDPESMYEELCELRGTKMDRCVLYVFRCAVYYASRTDHDPELLKWWHWKDPISAAVQT